MTSEDLFNYVQNDSQLHKQFVSLYNSIRDRITSTVDTPNHDALNKLAQQDTKEIIKSLTQGETEQFPATVVPLNQKNRVYIIGVYSSMLSLMDNAANKLAKENATWHDDPTAEDYAEYHKPASQQFPQTVRNKAIADLIKYFVNNDVS